MVNKQELLARIKEDLRFSKVELSTLLLAGLVTAFIFSFRDWGVDHFDPLMGLRNLLLLCIITAVSFAFRYFCQKAYGLASGNKVDFKVWWWGIVAMIFVGFVSMGRLPLVLIGGVSVGFMVRYRLGEFRYGHSWSANGFIALWGVLGNLIMAIAFTLGDYFFPSYFFHKGIILNLIMAACSLIPLPQLDGLMIFYSNRFMYAISWLTVALAAVLLATGTKIGLVLAIIIGGVAGAIALLISSNK